MLSGVQNKESAMRLWGQKVLGSGYDNGRPKEQESMVTTEEIQRGKGIKVREDLGLDRVRS